jgi:hypothetical protein
MFRVRWKNTALDQLADIWVQGDPELRSAITSAVQTIDKKLRIDPNEYGESREATDRVWFVFPLGIRFEVDDNELIVRILKTWSIRRKEK